MCVRLEGEFTLIGPCSYLDPTVRRSCLLKSGWYHFSLDDTSRPRLMPAYRTAFRGRDSTMLQWVTAKVIYRGHVPTKHIRLGAQFCVSVNWVLATYEDGVVRTVRLFRLAHGFSTRFLPGYISFRCQLSSWCHATEVVSPLAKKANYFGAKARWFVQLTTQGLRKQFRQGQWLEGDSWRSWCYWPGY